MGLDMHLYADGEEIGYWRKHPNIHGFMISCQENHRPCGGG
jgi:hypothetical protein